MTATLWDAASGKPLGEPRVFQDPLGWISDTNGVPAWARSAYRDPFDDWFSPDGKVLLVDDNPKSARLDRSQPAGPSAGQSRTSSRSFVPHSVATARES